MAISSESGIVRKRATDREPIAAQQVRRLSCCRRARF